MARILGLDIGKETVRAALVHSSLGKVEVERYMETPVPYASDPQGRAEALRLAMHAVVAACGRPPDRIVTAMDGRDVSLRIVELPRGAAKRIAEVLPFELESILPFPIEEAIVDYQLVELTASSLRVMTAATPREKVATLLAELSDGGIDARELAAGGAALDGLVTVLPPLREPGPLLLLDVGQGRTDICLLQRGLASHARTLSCGIADVTAGRLEGELHRTLSAFRNAGAPQPVQAFLMGDAADDPNAVGWFQEKLDIATAALPLPPAPGADATGRARFGGATALAARSTGRSKRIDLRQGEFAHRQAIGAVRQHVRLIAVCAAVVFTSFMFSTFARWFVLDGERGSLQAELARVTDEAFGEETVVASQARDLLERGPRTRDPLPRFDAFDALDAISGGIPAEITHNTRRLRIELDENGHTGEFELQGTVASVAERDQIAEQLEGHECIEELQRGPTRGSGAQGINYQIQAKIRCPGTPDPDEGNNRRGRGNP